MADNQIGELSRGVTRVRVVKPGTRSAQWHVYMYGTALGRHFSRDAHGPTLASAFQEADRKFREARTVEEAREDAQRTYEKRRGTEGDSSGS